MKRYELVLTQDAERDLEDLYHYIAEFDVPKKADHVLDRILEVADTLASFPEQGSPPRELRALGIREYRQVFFKPYRLIYRVIDVHVAIYLIVDGRRNMQTLLAQRLLGA
jgi:toxin ParE1/3/4